MGNGVSRFDDILFPVWTLSVPTQKRPVTSKAGVSFQESCRFAQDFLRHKHESSVHSFCQ